MPEGVSDAAVGGSVGVVSNMAYAPAPMPYKSEERSKAARIDMGMAPSETKSQPSSPSIRLKQLSGDRPGLRLDTLRPALEARLMDPVLVNLLAGLPKGTVLTLRVDASGRVTAASFDHGFKGAAKAVALIQAWRLRGRTDESSGEQVRQTRMTLPVGQQGHQQIGSAQ